jgi:hypothetical protein
VVVRALDGNPEPFRYLPDGGGVGVILGERGNIGQYFLLTIRKIFHSPLSMPYFFILACRALG